MVGSQHAHEPANDVFDILGHQRRRYALQCLREYENPMPLADLADEVAVREYDAPLPEIDAETVKRVYVSLYHAHIPKLADADHVRYSQEQDSVALADHAEQFDRLRAYLEHNQTATS